MGSNIVRFSPVRQVSLATLSASGGNYVTLGSALDHPMRVLHFINNTDGDMMISFDGTTDNAPLLAESFALYDLTSDQDSNESFRYEKGTQVYVRYITAPTTPADGAVYLVAVYGKGE